MHPRAAFLTLTCLIVSPAAEPLRSRSPLVVTVRATDYVFDLPDTLPAGPTTFRLINGGRMHHELVLFKTRAGGSWDQMKVAPTPEARRALADPPVGVIFAPTAHRQSADLVATLESGRWYMVFCGIRDSVDMPPHFMLGMIDSIYAR